MKASQTYFAKYEPSIHKYFEVDPRIGQEVGVITPEGIFKARYTKDWADDDDEEAYFDFPQGRHDEVLAWFPL